MSAIDARLAALGIVLSRPSPPAANYIPVRRAGRTLYISGQISANAEGVITGKLGANMDVAAGRQAARAAAVNVLTQIRYAAEASFEDITAFLRLQVLVNSDPGFTEPHLVANGASDLLVEVFGDIGRHSRAALGVATLPLGAAVEIETVVELKT